MVDRRVMGTLTNIDTEELGHLEIVATIIRQLTKNLTPEEIKASGFDKYYIIHFQRFREYLRRTQENLDCWNFYAFNQQIDKKSCGK